MRTLSLAALICFSLTTAAIAQDSAIVEFATDDAEMQAAEAAAKVNLSRFFTEAIGADGYSIDGTAIKVAFPTEDNAEMDTEVIWISPFGTQAGTYRGILANQPVALGDLMAGDVVDFSFEQIVDWSMVGPDGKLYGNYTTRVMLPHLSEDEAAGLREILSENPEPDFWSN